MIWFPDADVALAIHRGILGIEPASESGHPVKFDLLESALAAPGSHYDYAQETRIPVLGGILCSRLALNHCFIDGNKRTAVAAMLHFLQENSFTIAPDSQMQIYDPLISLIEGRTNEGDFIAVIQELAAPEAP